MKRAFDFVESLDSSFLDICGCPTIKVHLEFTEVYFDVCMIRSFKLLDRGCYDSVRLYGNGDMLTLVYVFNNED